MSLVLESPEDNFVFHQIVSPITWEEIKYMQEFGMEDCDGHVDCKEFMILAVVRIGAVSPDLIRRLNHHFQQLDLKSLGKIAYDDLIWGRRKPPAFVPFSPDSARCASPSSSRESSNRTSSSRISFRSSLSFKKLNRRLFSQRAKSVFAAYDSSASSEIEANIRKIQSLAVHNAASLRISTEVHLPQTCDNDSRPSLCSSLSVKKPESQSTFHCCTSDCNCDVSFEHYGSEMDIVSMCDDKGDDVEYIETDRQDTVASNTIDQHDTVASKLPPKEELLLHESVKKSAEVNDRKGKQDSTLGEESKNASMCQSPSLEVESLSSDKKKNKGENRNFTMYSTKASSVNQPSMKGRKYSDTLKKVKSERRKSRHDILKLSRKGLLERVVWKIKFYANTRHMFAFCLWLLWLTIGSIFLSSVEGLSVSEAIFVSTSVGYGIFWFDLSTVNAYTRVFCILHFCVGVFGVALTMALFANNLTTMKKEWYSEAKGKQSIRTALTKEEWWASFVALIKYYWPKVYVHFFFVLWMIFGIVWGVASLQLRVLDAWLFCMTAMATGGLVSLPSSGVHSRDYVFYSIFIAVGAPLMAISCGVLAHNISMHGKAAKIVSKINTPMTEDELVMLRHLDLEDDDGYIDRAEFVILVLVRIGALNPDMIGALFERFHEIDIDGKGNVTYDSLVKRESFAGSTNEIPKSFVRSMSRSFKRSKSTATEGNKRYTINAKKTKRCESIEEIKNENV